MELLEKIRVNAHSVSVGSQKFSRRFLSRVNGDRLLQTLSTRNFLFVNPGKQSQQATPQPLSFSWHRDTDRKVRRKSPDIHQSD
jgi:hypothetical protein